MLEGNELQGTIGEYGQYSVDVQDTGVVVVSLGLKVDLLAELRKLAKLTTNSLDDKAVDFIAHLIGKNPIA